MKKEFLLMTFSNLEEVKRHEFLLHDPAIENASISQYFSDGNHLGVYVKVEDQALYDNKVLDEIRKHMAFRNMETYEDYITLICIGSILERKTTIKKLKKLCLEYNYVFQKLGIKKNIN